ncbi:FAD binding domain-containing protein [Mycena amicta]|nr:FAD binding domain-containing protein [Mycena amicta]
MPVSLIRESDVDCLVIGAGPAGLMCANALAKAGVNVKIVDQRPSRVAAGQADGIQPRTIEVFQSYGLADRLLKEGNQMHVAAFYNPGPNGIELADRVPDVTAPTARYPFEVTLHQGAIESIFIDSMSSMGVEVSRPVVPTQLELDPTKIADPSAYAVRVVLKHLDDDTMEIVRARFVVGADGAHSWVRKTLDIAMEGSQTDYVWGVVDMVPETNFPDIRNKTAVHSENGSCMIIPREGDKVRIYIQLDGKDGIVDASNGRIDKQRISPQKLLEVASKSFHPYVFKTPKTIDWWTLYQIGQRIASKYSVDERVFIAGDACHTHSPKAGQGMNASMNDAHNLVWKMVYVLRGWAGISLLQTYESERRKYAQDLIDFDVKFSSLFSGKPRTEINHDGVSHEEFLKAFQTFGGFTSGIGIRYAESAIVNYDHQRYARNLVVGQRMPPQVLVRAADFRVMELQDLLPSDTRFKLLLFTGDADVAALQVLAEGMKRIVSKYGVAAVDVLSIVKSKRPNFNFLELPEILRSHWSKVFCDEKNLRGTEGGEAYDTFGIDPEVGAIVCVRPDGYVSMVAPLSEPSTIETYFAGFMG